MRKHDDRSSNTDLDIQAVTAPQRTIQRFTGWLGRVIGRSCAGGLWTISPDGKLRCEALRGDSCQAD
jgi:hypothetical protein